MNVVGRVGSYLSQGVYSVATPFHPFGGAVDIIVVQQQDGSFRSTPWYVRFGKFQGVLKMAEKIVKIEVNGVVADFHMFLDNSGEAYFIKEITPDKDQDTKDSDREESCASDSVDIRLEDDNVENLESDSEKRFYDDEQSYASLDSVENYDESENVDSEVILVSVDGQILTAPLSNSEAMEQHSENVQLNTPQFRLGLVEGPEIEADSEWANYLSDFNKSKDKVSFQNVKESELSMKSVVEDAQSDVKKDVFKSCLSLNELGVQEVNGEQEKSPRSVDFVDGQTEEESIGEMRSAESLSPSKSESSKSVVSLNVEVETESAVASPQDTRCNLSDENANGGQEMEELESGEGCTISTPIEPQPSSNHDEKFDEKTRIEISLCGNLLRPGMGSTAASEAFNAHRISKNEFQESASSIIKNDTLIVKIGDKYFTWDKAGHIVLGMTAFGLEMPVEPEGSIPVSPSGPNEEARLTPDPSGRRWRLWPLPFRRVKTLEHSTSNISSEDVFLDSESGFESQQPFATTPKSPQSPNKQFVRTNVPTNEQISSLNLKDGQNVVSFNFSTRVLGVQKVDAHIYLWKWNTRIVISDVDGTITKSDVLGQFMPLVGKDWTQSGVARLFSAIKENGYQLLFLSARAIVQAYLTRNYLINLKQDGKALPNGPVVISPNGLFPSLYREVIRRAPHEFKIACLEEIRALFPADYNPFYAGFGNRDTDELSYRKIGIPKGKIFIINPKGEVAISHRIELKGKSYTSLHTLVNDMFPPTSMVEQEDYNSWNYWKMPLPDVNL